MSRLGLVSIVAVFLGGCVSLDTEVSGAAHARPGVVGYGTRTFSGQGRGGLNTVGVAAHAPGPGDPMGDTLWIARHASGLELCSGAGEAPQCVPADFGGVDPGFTILVEPGGLGRLIIQAGAVRNWALGGAPTETSFTQDRGTWASAAAGLFFCTAVPARVRCTIAQTGGAPIGGHIVLALLQVQRGAGALRSAIWLRRGGIDDIVRCEAPGEDGAPRCAVASVVGGDTP